MQFIRKHINKALIIVDTQTQNIQRWDYPLDALREIVLNMIVHRDYRAKSESTIKIFSDHILFYNPGQLPDSITIEQLRQNNYVSKPYNKQVAKIFKEMGEIERFGTGVKRVCDMFIDYGLPKPEWLLTADGLVVKVFDTPSTDNVTENVTETISTEKSTEKNAISGQVTEQVTGQTEQVTEQVKRLLQVIDGEMTRVEIMLYLDLSHRPTFYYDYLNPALNSGLIAMTQPNSPKSPTKKYYLTEKGKRLLKQL